MPSWPRAPKKLEALPFFQKRSEPEPLKPGDWTAERDREYERSHHYMLAHVLGASNEPGQEYDVFVFVSRHRLHSPNPPQHDGFDEIDKAEFFFGPSWGNQVFVINKTDGMIGVHVHAWGTFLATCRLTFVDRRPPVILYRFADFFTSPEEFERFD